MAQAFTISVGKLGDLVKPEFCPRCFWIQLRMEEVPFQMPMPGIFSSIDAYVKNVVRKHFDAHGQLPSWFPTVGRVIGYQPPLHWSKFRVTDPKTGLTLQGVPDEIFRLESSEYHILDYKTTRLSGAQGKIFPSYEVQLNAYGYIAARLGMAPIAALTLVYLDPDTNLDTSPQWLARSSATLMLGFTLWLRPVPLQPESFIEELLSRAKGIMELSAPPAPAPRCPNCPRVADLMKLVS